jgi:hypothetical protein
MAGPGHEMAAGGGRGHLRASHADREQVIGTLKAAFVAGMLAKDEFDARVGQTLASRTFLAVAARFENRRDRRLGGQRGQAPGAGGPAFPRLPPAGSGGQSPSVDPGHRRTAEAARKQRARSLLPVGGPCAGGALAAGTAPASG